MQCGLFDAGDLPQRTRLELIIKMREELHLRAIAGFKRETRRTNISKYLKLEKGDWLMVHGSNIPLVVDCKPHAERLSEISNQSAIAEGIICAGDGKYYPSLAAKACCRNPFDNPRDAFFALWDESHPAHSEHHSTNNPMVAVIRFSTPIQFVKNLRENNNE